MMASEQTLLGDWKIEKIVEAAGRNFDEDVAHQNLVNTLDEGPEVTLFSFVDCPWCLPCKATIEGGISIR